MSGGIPSSWDRDITEAASVDKPLARRCSKRGITVGEFLTLYHDQSGRCAVCHETYGYPALAIDHNHQTGEVRGLLCRQCNSALGLLADRWDYAEAAAAYLRNRGTSHKFYPARTAASISGPDEVLTRIHALERHTRPTRRQDAELALLHGLLQPLQALEKCAAGVPKPAQVSA